MPHRWWKAANIKYQIQNLCFNPSKKKVMTFHIKSNHATIWHTFSLNNFNIYWTWQISLRHEGLKLQFIIWPNLWFFWKTFPFRIYSCGQGWYHIRIRSTHYCSVFNKYTIIVSINKSGNEIFFFWHFEYKNVSDLPDLDVYMK